MIPALETPLSGSASVGVGKVTGPPIATVVDAKGSRRSGRQDDSPLHPDADTPAEQPEGADSESPGNEVGRHEGENSHEAPVALAPEKDAGPGGAPPTGGVPFIADQIPPDRPDDPILGPQLRKRAAQAYAYGIKAMTRNPLALGVIFDNNS
jgi:hypothetical protein